MSSANAQKSEVHTTTGDAFSSPHSHEDRETTIHATSRHLEPSPKLNPTLPPDLHIIQDDSDVGGPLILESNDEALPHPNEEIRPQ